MLNSCARRAQVYLNAFIPERIIKIDKLLQRLLTAPYLGTLFSEACIACSALWWKMSMSSSPDNTLVLISSDFGVSANKTDWNFETYIKYLVPFELFLRSHDWAKSTKNTIFLTVLAEVKAAQQRSCHLSARKIRVGQQIPWSLLSACLSNNAWNLLYCD